TLGSVAMSAVSTCTQAVTWAAPNEGNTMNTSHVLKRGIVGLTTAVLVSGVMGLAALGLAGTAHARPTWCPGDPMPREAPWPDFQWNSCYEYTGGDGKYGWTDLGTGIFHPMPL